MMLVISLHKRLQLVARLCSFTPADTKELLPHLFQNIDTACYLSHEKSLREKVLHNDSSRNYSNNKNELYIIYLYNIDYYLFPLHVSETFR